MKKFKLYGQTIIQDTQKLLVVMDLLKQNLMVISMFMGIMAMTGGAASENVFYLIPLYNTAQSILGIFSLGEVGIPVLLTVISNLTFAGLGIYLLTKIFRSEKILFSA